MTRRALPLVIVAALIAVVVVLLPTLVPPSARPVFWLLRDVDHGDPLVATRALEALGRRGGEDIAIELTNRLESEHPQSSEIAQALGVIGRPAVRPLAEVLERSSPAARANAAIALGRMADGAAFEPLSKALSADSSKTVRLAVVRAFGSVPGLESEQRLFDTINGTDLDLAYFAALSLGRRGSVTGLKLIDGVCDRLSSDAGRRGECVKTIATIGGAEAIGMLASRLGSDPSPYVRYEIAALLGRSGDERATAALDAAAAARQLEVIANAFPYFLRVEPLLDDQLIIDAYRRLGAKDMEDAMRASRRPALIQAVAEEAAKPIKQPKMIEVR